jgi:hypothetical protein
MSDKASKSKVKINYINRLPSVLTTSILTHLTLADLWDASCASRQLYVACCYDATIWQRATAALGTFRSLGTTYPTAPGGLIAIYEDNFYHCLKPLSSSSSSSSSAPSSPPGGAVIPSSTLTPSSYLDISLLPRGRKQLISLYQWRYQWRALSRCREIALSQLTTQSHYQEHTREIKICVGGAGGSGKSALTIRYVTGNIFHSILPPLLHLSQSIEYGLVDVLHRQLLG